MVEGEEASREEAERSIIVKLVQLVEESPCVSCNGTRRTLTRARKYLARVVWLASNPLYRESKRLGFGGISVYAGGVFAIAVQRVRDTRIDRESAVKV